MQKSQPAWLPDLSTWKHLRFPFSFYLMPVFLFALSEHQNINISNTVLAFVILHVMLFPSSNGYNSTQDRDTSSIGGLKFPPPISSSLSYVTLIMDLLAIIFGLFISITFSLLVFVFITMSRAYSYRKIRLKKYPVIGFLTVFIFQGAFIYVLASSAMSPLTITFFKDTGNLMCMAVSSFFIGSIYPLTQIYQHEADKSDGVISISYMLGYTGTFLFSGILFLSGTVLLILHFLMTSEMKSLMLFLIMTLPVAICLNHWFGQVRKNHANADFEHAMAINKIGATSMNLFFVVMALNHHFLWFK